MAIILNKSIPYSIIERMKKIFTVTFNDRGDLKLLINNKTLKQILVDSQLLDDSECIITEQFRFVASGKETTVNGQVLAYTVSLNVRDSIDIDFIFKPDDLEILFKDSLYWKSFYFYSRRNIQDNGNIYENIAPSIIPYMIYGKYITEMEGAVDNSLIELYRKGERNFKNLLVLNDMVNI